MLCVIRYLAKDIWGIMFDSGPVLTVPEWQWLPSASFPQHTGNIRTERTTWERPRTGFYPMPVAIIFQGVVMLGQEVASYASSAWFQVWLDPCGPQPCGNSTVPLRSHKKWPSVIWVQYEATSLVVDQEWKCFKTEAMSQNYAEALICAPVVWIKSYPILFSVREHSIFTGYSGVLEHASYQSFIVVKFMAMFTHTFDFSLLDCSVLDSSCWMRGHTLLERTVA